MNMIHLEAINAQYLSEMIKLSLTESKISNWQYSKQKQSVEYIKEGWGRKARFQMLVSREKLYFIFIPTTRPVLKDYYPIYSGKLIEILLYYFSGEIISISLTPRQLNATELSEHGLFLIAP